MIIVADFETYGNTPPRTSVVIDTTNYNMFQLDKLKELNNLMQDFVAKQIQHVEVRVGILGCTDPDKFFRSIRFSQNSINASVNLQAIESNEQGRNFVHAHTDFIDRTSVRSMNKIKHAIEWVFENAGSILLQPVNWRNR